MHWDRVIQRFKEAAKKQQDLAHSAAVDNCKEVALAREQTAEIFSEIAEALEAGWR